MTQRRLQLALWVIFGADLFYFALYLLVWTDISTWFGTNNALVQIVVSFSLALFLSRVPLRSSTLAWVALGFQVFFCYSLALTGHWHLYRHNYQAPPDSASWVCVVMFFFPLLVPASFSKMLAAAVLSALADTAAFVTAMTFSGQELPPDRVTVGLLLPTYLCAVLLIIPFKILRRLRQEASEARQLGSYRLEERLGKGGMGEVWKARHRLLARPAAVKVISPELMASGGEVTEPLQLRFEREVQATAMLRSPHTVEVYDFGRSLDGTFYYVMELLHGMDLKDLVEQEGPLPEPRVRHFMIQACDSLDEAHRAGLIHRDIKPANLFVTHYGGVHDMLKVLDFGLAKSAVRDAGAADLTGAMTVIGTPAFLPPEVASGGQELDGRSDLYSLGCVAFFLLTGRHVFEGPSAMAVAASHLSALPPAPSSVASQEVSPEMDAIVLSCLAKDPAQRPESAMALMKMLRAYQVERHF